MKFAVMREATTFISLMKDANELNSSILLLKVLFKRLQRRMICPCTLYVWSDSQHPIQQQVLDKR